MPSTPQPSRPQRLRAAVAMSAIGAALYLAGLAVVVLSPEHLDGHADLLFRVAFRLFPSANGREVDFGFNVLLFLPFGILLAPLLRSHAWAVLVVAWAVPTVIEIAQGLFLPGRVSSIFDVVANAAGTLTAALFVEGMRRRLTR